MGEKIEIAALICLFILQIAYGATEVVVVVLSQHNSHHELRAYAFQQHILDQVQPQTEKVKVVLSHEKWPAHAAWPIFSIIHDVHNEMGDCPWVIICEEETRIDVTKLLHGLAQYDASEPLLIGQALRDRHHVIIHHYNAPADDFSYPNIAAGVAFSKPLMKLFSERLKNESLVTHNFQIDPKHEFALFLWKGSPRVSLTNSELFCTRPVNEGCATSHPVDLPDCGKPVKMEDIFIGIKTCEKFHNERIPIIKKLWTKDLPNLEYYSETADPSIPTIDLGVPNTERGHCGKTYAIMNRSVSEDYIKSRQWLVIADDDTLMNVDRLRALLACYDASEPVALGERYGYAMLKHHGYEYITGGGGMVFSMEAVRWMVACKHCKCVKNDQADDMLIGMWLMRLGIPITHTALFHQARVDDYAPEYLAHQRPVSFHKFWNNDPEKDYKEYLTDEPGSEALHDEF